MNFFRLSLAHKTLLESWFSRNDTLMSVNDFALLYAWDVNEETVCNTDDDVLTVRITVGDKHSYYCPFVPDDRPITPYIERIREYEGDAPHVITHIPPRYAQELAQLDGYAPLMQDRDNFDYVYSTQDLLHLPGRRYHAKRNYLHRFFARHPFRFTDYTDEDLDAVMGLYQVWKGDDEGNDDERIAITRALNSLAALGMSCGLIWVGDALVAMGIVSVSARGVGQVHFEKAHPDFEDEGAYQAINQLCAEKYLSGTVYINRQEDMGIPGLRHAKLSYCPVYLIENYRLWNFENECEKTVSE